ncbi:type 1 glutamine amidotransferase domain-containing protein [Dyadobacter sp. CY326]|uniref:type 1 glutamine amidotransferase domain-containing protein n=1 Tax=Dyadobacter sp. CY326 TaxID=2907300 RepID=UPI001F35741A|nr:type 1 glutamine amidotransferase domain-containing protein [Dyadobacter sp. CY326]MCE7064972.1 type 1 glutamine amidotransferase domain-containing protein [Dyadobacter sp. CY326]
MKNILMILTSHKDMENTDSKTGVWLGEFTDPYYEFIDQGYSVVLASPKGGTPPVDPMSTLTENITASNRRFQDDSIAQRVFENTIMLEEADLDKFDAVFYPGGHGPIWDLADSATSGQIILDFLDSGRPVGAVCHGPAALIAAALLRPGLLKGKKLAGFTNTEEALTFRSDNVPYKLEDRLIELGADFDSALIPFTSHVETDGLLITGQNPASAGPTAKALIEFLEKQPVSAH